MQKKQSTKKPAAKKAPRSNWKAVAERNAHLIITQGKELHAVSAALVRQEEMTKQAHERASRFETANARARFHWENCSAWFYLACAWRALTGRPNNTNGIHL